MGLGLGGAKRLVNEFNIESDARQRHPRDDYPLEIRCAHDFQLLISRSVRKARSALRDGAWPKYASGSAKTRRSAEKLPSSSRRWLAIWCNTVEEVKLSSAKSATAASSSLELLALDEVRECAISQSAFATVSPPPARPAPVSARSSVFRTDSRCLASRGMEQWFGYACRALDRAPSHMLSRAAGSALPIEREEVCGDAWEVIETAGVLRAMVVDGLGHGPFAGEAAREAVAVFRSQATTGVASTLKLIDQALTKTRGAAGAIVEICPAKGQVTAAGVGNISMRLLNDGESKSFGCDNGTLGTGVPQDS